MRRRIARAMLAIAGVYAAGLQALPVWAQAKYPERPIRLVIPFSPGGNADILGRKFAAKLTPQLGQQVVVDNKAGADGAIGSAEVARARGDGYTLLIGSSGTHAINPSTMENLAYDAVKDFSPIALLGVIPISIAVHPTVASALPELLKRVRANPGKYSYGSSGMGGSNHLAGEFFKKQAGGLDIVHVPYKGSGPSVQDVVAGQIPIVITTFSSVVTHHRSGRLRILATFNSKRSDIAPEVPTAIELGVPGMVAFTFNVLLAPSSTPRQIVGQLHQATMKVMGDEEFRKDLANLTIEPVTDSNPEKAAQFIKDEIAKWAPVVKATGTKAH